MKQVLSYLCWTMMALGCCSLHADEQIDSSSTDPSMCTKEELMTYFPQALVKSTLIKSGISDSQAAAISEKLAQKGQELEKKVADKASQLEPNPFKDLSQRDVAIKIYRETLYEIFAQVLKANGITKDEQIQNLLDEVQIAKSKLFVDCIRREQEASKKSSPPLVPSS